MTTNEMGDAAFRIEMIANNSALERELALAYCIKRGALDIAEMLGLVAA